MKPVYTYTTLRLLAGALVLLMAGACTEYQTKPPPPPAEPDSDRDVTPDLISTNECTVPSDTCFRINILFQKLSPPEITPEVVCPVWVGTPETLLKKPTGGGEFFTRIEWQAWQRSAETDSGFAPLKVKYWVLFSPFYVSSGMDDPDELISSDPATGNTGPVPVRPSVLTLLQDSNNAFPAGFKYTIVGAAAQGCRNRPLDPRIRVH